MTQKGDTKVRLHDYDKFFEIPGLYEEVIYNKLQCKSPKIICSLLYEEIKKAPIPVNIAAINALKGSSLALDIYFWLSYRLGYLMKPTEISFTN